MSVSFRGKIQKICIHHNLFITGLLGSKVETMLGKQRCCIPIKMPRLYRKIAIPGNFSIFWAVL